MIQLNRKRYKSFNY